MAEYGEWNRKGATLSDVTAEAEYGVDRNFIVKGIQSAKLEYRDGAISADDVFSVMRTQKGRASSCSTSAGLRCSGMSFSESIPASSHWHHPANPNSLTKASLTARVVEGLSARPWAEDWEERRTEHSTGNRIGWSRWPNWPSLSKQKRRRSLPLKGPKSR
jgi:hypothetical protein